MPIDFNSLTSKQKKVYSSIEAFIKQKGIPPTVREIGEMVGEKTPGAVQGILNRLEQKGVIKREMGMARSIKLVQDSSNYPQPVYIPEIKKVSKRNIDNLLNIYNIEKYQPIPPDIIEQAENCFILKCPDNSLAESGITYNDLIFIKQNIELKEGDIALIIYENHTLLRRFYSNSEGSLTLKADSDLIGKEVFNNNEVTIIGKLVGRYTKY